VTVKDLDTAPADVARELLTACCGASPWVDAMLAARPFGDAERLFAAADRCWTALSAEQLGTRSRATLGSGRRGRRRR
jgi:hypothetical protein